MACLSCRPGVCQACSASSQRCWVPSGSPSLRTRSGYAFTLAHDPLRHARCYPLCCWRPLPSGWAYNCRVHTPEVIGTETASVGGEG
jgi:hypothetical protein